MRVILLILFFTQIAFGQGLWRYVRALTDSNYVLTSETATWDKDSTNDVKWTDTTSVVATQNDLTLGYQPLDADLTDLADGSLTFSKVAGLQDSMNVANAYVDSNYVLTSETSGWDKTSWKFPKGYIWGLTLSNNGSDANNDIDIAVGQASDGDAEGDMILAGALTKQLDAGWAVGTNQGGLNTGSEANSTWYEVHLIKRTDTGVVDVMFTTTANRATLPANYTLSRRIGWVYNDASGNIKAFTQRGNEFTWTTQVNDGAGNKSTTAAQVTLTVPPYCVAKIRVAVDMNTSVNANSSFVVSEIAEGNVTPAVGTGIVTAGYWDLTTGVGTGQLWIRADVNRQIEWDADVAQGTFDISTYGFIDERCQYGDY